MKVKQCSNCKKEIILEETRAYTFYNWSKKFNRFCSIYCCNTLDESQEFRSRGLPIKMMISSDTEHCIDCREVLEFVEETENNSKEGEYSIGSIEGYRDLEADMALTIKWMELFKQIRSSKNVAICPRVGYTFKVWKENISEFLTFSE